MTGDIVEGKEYIFVPRPEIEKQWGHAHGRTVIPRRSQALFHDEEMYTVDINGPLAVFADELIDPEGS